MKEYHNAIILTYFDQDYCYISILGPSPAFLPQSGRGRNFIFIDIGFSVPVQRWDTDQITDQQEIQLILMLTLQFIIYHLLSTSV